MLHTQDSCCVLGLHHCSAGLLHNQYNGTLPVRIHAVGQEHLVTTWPSKHLRHTAGSIHQFFHSYTFGVGLSSRWLTTTVHFEGIGMYMLLMASTSWSEIYVDTISPQMTGATYLPDLLWFDGLTLCPAVLFNSQLSFHLLPASEDQWFHCISVIGSADVVEISVPIDCFWNTQTVSAPDLVGGLRTLMDCTRMTQSTIVALLTWQEMCSFCNHLRPVPYGDVQL